MFAILKEMRESFQNLFPAGRFRFVLLILSALGAFISISELLLLKAETLKKQYEVQFAKYGKNFKSDALYAEMETVYAILVKLHYKEIPLQMYDEWMASLERDKNIYNNKEINVIFNTQSK